MWRFVCVLTLALCACTGDADDPINAVIGDESWTLARPPRDERERIATHLAYVADRLTDDEPALAPDVRARRRESIAALRAYAERGVFPQHDVDFGRHVPRFVDADGTPCAVAFLLARTSGWALVREIDERYEYALIEEMDDPRIDEWARDHGFTRRELAMIQPGYGPPPCDGWGRGDNEDCPSRVVRERRVAYGLALGGGLARADGLSRSYFQWAADVRVAVTSWLAIGVAGIGVRIGNDGTQNLTALAATPIVELSRWYGGSWGSAPEFQLHADLGATFEHVLGTGIDRNPFGAELALGFRVRPRKFLLEPGFSFGVAVALADGFMVDDRVSAGSVLPFVRFEAWFRP